ncbi:transcriptional regulator TACO1-like protein [Coniella lustricola]|uniref:Transcriptional regulator TACO1-like protein n=1 Tax=Coniella lustricola TaxID=2025994 RepID=A0A2T3AFS9_9PEZI|nr:transcriptional regulator TACO1-like protein [Coniella lustricola]
MATTLWNLGALALRPARPAQVCSRCSRMFATSARLQAGHNKWSKIKHTKGRADKDKASIRTLHVRNITLYSRLYGPDPNANTSLANAIALAKKAATPKSVIDGAVARGQGRSMTGTALESMKFEAMFPSSAAFIIDVETDNKLRALQDVNHMIKKHQGRTTTTEYLFSRRGRVVFERHDKLGQDDVLEAAIESGAEDLETDDEDNIIVWCAPTQTMQLAQSISTKFGFKILTSDIIWMPNENTQTVVDSPEDVKLFSDFVAALSEFPDVQSIYCNALKGESVTEEEWEAFADNLDC